VPCARLSWPFRLLLSARKYIVSCRLCFFFYFDTVGWVTGRITDPRKKSALTGNSQDGLPSNKLGRLQDQVDISPETGSFSFFPKGSLSAELQEKTEKEAV